MVSRNSGLDTRGRAGPAPRTPTSPLKVEVKPVTGGCPTAAEEKLPPPAGKIQTLALAQALRCSPDCAIASPLGQGPRCVPAPWTPYLPRADGQWVFVRYVY